MNWQPIIDLLTGRVMLFMLVVTWAAMLFGVDRVAGWIEAIGAEGVMRLAGQ
jgi:hypothetical protein